MKTLTYNPNKNIVLLDSGYILCHQYYATSRFLSFKDPDSVTDEDIEICFRKHLTNKLKKYIKILSGLLYLCKDMPTSSVWRSSLFPQYKGNRPTGLDLGPFIKIMFEVCNDLRIETIELPRAEADDIIALSIKNLRELTKTTNIVIITSDRDFIQLVRFGNIVIKDANLNNMIHDDPTIELWTKILMGDKSDNIPPVFDKCGKKTALKLAVDKQKRDEVIKKKGCETQLSRNISLIAMDVIPLEIEEMYQANYGWNSEPDA